MARTVWDSSVGKKTVMAVSGLIMLLYLVVHMIGNLKIFFGAGSSTTTPTGCAPSANPSCTTSGRSG